MAYGNTLTPEQIASAKTPEQLANPQAITPSSLTPATPIQPATPPPAPTPVVPDFLKITQPEQQTQDQYSGISSAIASLTGELAGRDAFTTGQQQQQDIIGKQTAVQNYQNQLRALQQEQQGTQLQREQNIQAKTAAMTGQGIAAPIIARHNAIDTQYNQQTLTNAIKQYSVGAQLSAAQGDLTSALNYVDQAVKLKYQPIEAQLTAQQANLQAIQNSPNFTSAQKKQAAAQQLQLQLYTQQIADEKKVYQDTQDAIIKTVTNNPNITPQQNAAISAAKSPAEVAQLVNYFGLSSLSQQERFNQDLQTAKFKQDEKQFGMNYALQQQKFEEDKRQFGINTDLKEAELNQKSAEANLDPAQAIAYAQEYASTGKIPTGIPKGSFGVVSQLAKEAPKQPGEIISTATGVKPSTDSTYADSLANLSSVIDLAKVLKEQDKNRIGGIVPGTLGALTGSQSQGAYLSTRQQIVDLLSRARSGAALTEQEVKTYENMLPGRFSEPFGIGQNSDKKIQNFIDTLTKDLTNKASAKGWSIYGVSKVRLDDGKEYIVGQTITNAQGQKGRVNADGSITIL